MFDGFEDNGKEMSPQEVEETLNKFHELSMEDYKKIKRLEKENKELREILNDILNSLLETDFAKKGYCNALLRIIGEENDVEKTKQRIKEYIYD